MLGLAAGLQKGGSALLTYVKDNLKLYLNFTSNKSDTLKFPCEGSTSFDGTNDYIISGSNSGISGDSARTVSCWVNLTSSSDADPIVCLDEDGSGTMFAIVIGVASGGNWAIRVGSGDDLSSSSSSTSDFGSWVFLTATHDGTTTKLYRNGVEIASGARTLTTTDGSVYIGTDTSRYTNAKVANVGIWSRALSLEEVNSVMRKNYSQLKSVEKTSLVSWWALDSAKIDGSELWDADASTFDSGTHSWEKYHNDNGRDNDSGTLKITRPSSGGDNRGAYVWLRDISDLSTDLIIGVTYKFTFDAKVNSGSSVQVAVGGPIGANVTVTETSFTSFSITFVATATASNYVGMGLMEADEIIWLDNFSLKAQVTTDSKNSNNGTVVGATTTTSVYGGHAPVLPRAVDVAREGEAEAIGDGSASFTVGDTDYILSGSNIGITGSAPRTISAWIKLDSNPSSGNLYDVFSYGTASTKEYFEYGIYNNSGTEKAFANVWGSDLQVTQTFTTGEWYHYAVVFTEASKLELYVNGISVGESSAISSVITADSTFNIGRRSNDSGYFNGDIAQLGVWAGELTQAQIQSVMESTSYAKIPASVKNTLGGECVANGDFSGDASLWNQTDAKWSIDETNDYASYADGADGSLIQTDGNNLVSIGASKFYRIKFTISSGGGNAVVHWYSANLSQTLAASATYADGDHTIYSTSPADYSGGVIVRGKNSGGTYNITNISIKEVTNDLVAYYPLDADSSRGNGTDDVTTGEVLGDELIENGVISTNQFTLNPAYDAGTGKGVTIDNGTVRIRTAGNTSVYIEDSNLFESGALYKIVAVVSDATSGDLYFRGGNVYVTNQASTVGTHTIYLKTDGTNLIIARDDSTVDISISSLSIKKVTSNTGVLK